MNRNEFENWMKGKLQDQPFSPGEDMWQKLQTDLQKPASGNKKAFMLLPWMKIAASVTVILSLGVATTLIIKNNNKKEITTEIATTDKTATTPALAAQPDADIQETQKQPVIHSTAQNITNKLYNKTLPANKTGQEEKTIITHHEPEVFPDIAQSPQVQQKNTQEPQAPARQERINKNTPRILQPEAPDHNTYAKNDNDRQAINLGMAANVGKSTISNMGYQVGVVGRGNISKRIFVEAGISVASNTVNNSSQHSFSGVELGFDGLNNTNTETKTTTNIQADYARNIISVGVTPSVGVKVTKRISVSTGGAVYRNLNPSLTLTNKDAIEAAALSNDIISSAQTITHWDIGLTCNADYKVTKNLSVNVNYRKGLTDYLQQNNKYIKNSGVQLGLKFLFGK